MVMNDNWQNALQSLLDGGQLPEGNDVKAATDESLPSQRGRLVVAMEKKGRGGKTATIISGFTLSDGEVCEIAAKLKSKLGTGGSARGGEILIQGNRIDDVKNMLRQMGFKV